MAVDLADLLDSVKRETSPPGTDLYPDASDDAWIGSLTDAFWEIRLYGIITGFEENVGARGGPIEYGEGIVTPTGVEFGYDDPDGYVAADLGRELQQLIVLWAGWKTVLNQMQNLNSTFRAKAGPVEFETQKSATVLKGVLDALRERIDYVTVVLRQNSGVVVLDAIVERTYSQAIGETWWLR